VPNERVIEAVEFDTTDPALRGQMMITIALSDADGGTDALGLHEGLPPGLSVADNEAGWAPRPVTFGLRTLRRGGGRG
jgi:hypothetical protein